jgi:serine/threonine protein kinase
MAGVTDLYKRVRAEGGSGLPWTVAQTLLFQIASGVAYLHEEEGIAHCDLKPENIAISEDGCAKIVDFGEAVDVTSEVSALERPRGTMPFIPPEVLLLSPQWDPIACDLWQLAVIHFEILCGIGAFEKLMCWGKPDFRSLPRLRRCAEELMLCFAEAAKANTLATVPEMCDLATPPLATELLSDMLQPTTTLRLPASSVVSRLGC